MSAADQARRIAYLEAAGWERVSDTWELNTDDPRYAVVGSRERATGSTFEDATYAAYRIQLRREALDLRNRQLSGPSR